MKTFTLKKGKVDRKWYLVDAQDKVLGRLASRIALVLQGKNKPSYTPNVDMSDFVVIVNAEKIKVTGKKMENKKYQSHSMYPGGFKEKRLEDLLKTKPEEVLKRAVKTMLPFNKLRDRRMKKLKVYKGFEHPHKSVKLESVSFTK